MRVGFSLKVLAGCEGFAAATSNKARIYLAKTSAASGVITLGVRGDVLTQYIASTLLVLGR
jgi:hypothetical protein